MLDVKLPAWLEKRIAELEHGVFGVCSFWGGFLGISSAKIRIFFIYASFLAKGSPIIVYLIMAFLIDLKKYFRNGQSKFWDL